ncbi:MAG: hypothetical protein Q8L66_10430 [Caulobacter sp.]|nr:hypothetical protein [Caulobacter sp.]
MADYMAASEQARRGIVQSCKYRPTVRVVQHAEARAAIKAAFLAGPLDAKALKEKADFIRNKLSDSVFEGEVNDHNADYVAKFAEVAWELDLPAAVISAGADFPAHSMNGVRVTFATDLSLQRVTKTNRVRTGGVVLRYAKSKALSPKIAMYHSAYAFGRMSQVADPDVGEPEKKLCIVLDANTAQTYEAPGNAGYLYKEMGAACLAIAERWAAIKPPPGAVVKGG